jgi:hypothetical protein
MHSRPLPVTVAAILLVLLSLLDFPWPYELFSPGPKNHRRSSFTRGTWWASWASSPLSDYGC